MGIKHRFVAAALVFAAPSYALALANAAVSVAAEVSGEGKDDAETGDKAYAAGDFKAALAAYGEGFSETQDPDFIWAIAKTQQALGKKAEAKALFSTYLKSGEKAHEAEASKESGVKVAATGAVRSAGGLGGALGGVVDTGSGAVATVVSGADNLKIALYQSLKVDVSDRVGANAEAKTAAESGDQAYAAGKFQEADKSYDQAYEKSEAAAALFAEGMADARAGDGAEARAELAGYLATGAKGAEADKAKEILLAVGGSLDTVAKVSISGKVSTEAKAEAQGGDKAFKAGQYVSAAKFYGDAFAKKSDSVALYGKGMAQYAEGDVTEAKATLQQYVASSGKVEFKAQAETTLKACGN